MDARMTTLWLRLAVLLASILATTGVASAGGLPVVRQFAAPASGAEGMAFVGSDLWIWTVDGSSLLHVVDPLTGAVVTSHPGLSTGGVVGLAYDGTSLWAVSADAAYPPFLAQLDATDGSLIRYHDLPVGNPTGIAFDGQHLLIAETDGHRIVKVDPISIAVEETIQKEPTLSYNIAWDGTALWLAGSAHESAEYVFSLYRIDPCTGATIGKYDVPDSSAVGLAFKDGLLYISDVIDDTIYVVSVPEPSTFLIVFATGIVFSAAIRGKGCRSLGGTSNGQIQAGDSRHMGDPARGSVHDR